MTYIKTLGLPHRRQLLLGAVLSPLAGLPRIAQALQPQALRTIELSAGIHKISAMVAETPAQRQIGLMYRTEMAPNAGMLFVFEQPSPQCFWMKNTPLPLSIAFLEDDGTVVNIADMKPQDETSHCSSRPVRLALEMHRGWFARRGIKAGSRLSGPAFSTR